MADISKINVNNTTYDLRDRRCDDKIEIYYGECSTDGATAQKEVTISNVTALTAGLSIRVKFANANSVAYPTLKLNSFDAIAMYRYGATTPATSAAGSWNSGEIVTLTYDGSAWYLTDFNNTTYTSMSVSEATAGTATTARVITAARLKAAILVHAPAGAIYYGECDTAGNVAMKEVTISNVPTLVAGLQILVKFANTNTIDSPTLKLNSLDAIDIKRYGTTGPSDSPSTSWNSGEIVTLTYDGTYWYLTDFNNTIYTSMTDAEYQAGTSTSQRTITPARLKGAIDYHTSGKADKTDTVLDTTLSCGRVAGSTVGNYSLAFGVDVTASGNYSQAVGNTTVASGIYGHAEGRHTTASAATAHAEGNYTVASGNQSHAEGNWTIANHKAQHVAGQYNIADSSAAAATELGNYVEIIGNGTDDNARSNARTLDWSGNGWFAGKVSAGTVANPANPTAANDLVTKGYLDTIVGNIETLLAAI